MNQLIQAGGMAATMTSQEIAELTGKEHGHVLRDIRAMLGALVGMSDGTSDGASLDWKMTKDAVTQVLDHEEIQGVTFDWDYRGYASHIRLPKNLTLTLVAGYNVKLRKRIVDRLEELERQATQPKALSPAEQLVAQAHALLSQERRLAEHDQAIAAVQATVGQLAETRVWDHCPQNCEPITKIRARMNKRYGLPAWVVDMVMRELPLSLKVHGMVRNNHESAEGSHYEVWAVADVTRVFKQFVSECKQETAWFATHPMIPERFKLRQVEGEAA